MKTRYWLLALWVGLAIASLSEREPVRPVAAPEVSAAVWHEGGLAAIEAERRERVFAAALSPAAAEPLPDGAARRRRCGGALRFVLLLLILLALVLLMALISKAVTACMIDRLMSEAEERRKSGEAHSCEAHPTPDEKSNGPAQPPPGNDS